MRSQGSAMLQTRAWCEAMLASDQFPSEGKHSNSVQWLAAAHDKHILVDHNRSPRLPECTSETDHPRPWLQLELARPLRSFSLSCAADTVLVALFHKRAYSAKSGLFRVPLQFCPRRQICSLVLQPRTLSLIAIESM